MQLGVDWAWGGLIDPAILKAQGYSAVLRYLAPSADNKNITPAEAQAYLNAGLAIVLVWEHTADQIRGGAAQGKLDGQGAGYEAAALGAPLSVPIYAAADYDAPQSDWPNIAAYLDAFRAACGHPVGIYGDAGLCDQMVKDGHATYIWQTVAWSNGALLPNANIFQPAVQAIVGGKTCDVDKLLTLDYGQWVLNAPPSYGPNQSQYNPPLVLQPVAASAFSPGVQGFIQAASDGSIYTWGDQPFHGAAAGQTYFVGRKVSEVRIANQDGLPYTIKATSGEYYDYGYQPGQVPLRW